MFFVTHNDSGPRVVLAQVLLRLKGINLQITGTWDKPTDDAVAQYRAKLQLTPHGPVNGPVFFQLIQNTRLKLVDSVDGAGGDTWKVDVGDLRKSGIAPLINERFPGHGVAVAVEKIIGRSKDHKIAGLRVTGHGNRGTWICVAIGDPVHARPDDYKAMQADYPSYIDLSHFEFHRPTLKRLTSLFAPFGSVELHGCRIGNQKQLLQDLADLWEVPVTGGLGDQQSGGYYVNEYGERVAYIFVFTGQVNTVYPHGLSLASWAAQIDAAIPNLPGLIDQIDKKLPKVLGNR